MADTNHDDRISPSEFLEIAKLEGFKPSEAVYAFSALDLNNDVFITREEIDLVYTTPKENLDAFEFADSNKDGKLNDMREYKVYLDKVRPWRDRRHDKRNFYRDDTTYPYDQDIYYPDVVKYGSKM